MHLTINHKIWAGAIVGTMLSLALVGCGRSVAPTDEQPTAAVAFQPLAITDSSKIVTYPNGLQLYIAFQGPGDFPINGTHVQLHFSGRLEDGTIFDESYRRGKPLEFSLGSGSVIKGIEDAVKKMRLGSKAIAVIPPSLGYGDGKGKNELPPKIPANATLTFQLELIGTF
jgi:peptidylprolyl isomerase